MGKVKDKDILNNKVNRLNIFSCLGLIIPLLLVSLFILSYKKYFWLIIFVVFLIGIYNLIKENKNNIIE